MQPRLRSGNLFRRATTTWNIEIYLERYPEGTFAELARARLHGDSTVEEPGVELAFWETVRAANNAAMIEAYLAKYPDGEFKALAEILLQELGGARGRTR